MKRRREHCSIVVFGVGEGKGNVAVLVKLLADQKTMKNTVHKMNKRSRSQLNIEISLF